MTNNNPSQLLLLADHIKLSLLERQRAISLNLEPNSQDGHISRSLDTLREGIDGVEKERRRLADVGDSTASANLQDQESRLRQQLDDLVSQFHGFPTSHSSVVIAQPNDLSLSSTFAHATSSDRPRLTSSHSSSLKRSPTTASHNQPSSKSVRFSDHSTQHHNNTATAAAGVFPYHDDPEDDNNDTTTELSNTSIHAHHAHVLREQDEQLDRLGVSIGRQRELSIQIGDELEDQVQLLDEVDQHVDRHQNRLDGARKSLGVVARRAKENVLLTVIFILIIVLVLLIIILK